MEYYHTKFNSAVASFTCCLPQDAWGRTDKLIGSGRLCYTYFFSVFEFGPQVYLKMPTKYEQYTMLLISNIQPDRTRIVHHLCSLVIYVFW